MAKRIIFLFLFILLSLNFIYAQPPVTQLISDNGYQIKIPSIGTLQQNQDFDFIFRVYNYSNGYPIDNSTTNCYLQIYLNNGTDIYNQQVPHIASTPNNAWQVLIDAGNFSNSGEYGYVVSCYSTTNILGGVTNANFHVTYSGEVLDLSGALINLGMIAILILLFVLSIYAIYWLPNKDYSNEDGEIFSVSNLKYLRMLMFPIAWGVLIAIFFLSANISLAYLNSPMFGNILFAIWKMMFIATLPMFILGTGSGIGSLVVTELPGW